MEASEINTFTPILVPGKMYRISGFTCIDTDNWQQTLQNKTSLSFTRFTKFEPIPDNGFPTHFFDFISYNQLPDRVVDPNDTTRTTNPVLTGNENLTLDYICIKKPYFKLDMYTKTLNNNMLLYN